MQDDTKLLAARRSMDYVENGMRVGLGSGSTAKLVLELLGERVRQGLKIVGIPTSQAAADLAIAQGIPLTDFDHLQHLDIDIDGADEVGPGLALIKGGGGALLHEKIVARAAKRVVIVVGDGKVVPLLGKFPLPVEVVPFAAKLVENSLEAIGGHPKLRMKKDGSGPYITDEQNYIFDCAFGLIEDPKALAASIDQITGVVEHGLFLNIATEVIVADATGIRLLTR